MGSRGGAKKEIDPEEQMRRKFRAKCLFRALGRLVMSNTYWLIEAVKEYQGDDVKRRVEQAVRAKAKQKALLNINDKALLNKDANERTEQEKHYLYRIIGGLKCFKRYPNNVKRKLAALTYFKYYGPGRVIVRQHQEAHAMYFIVTGDVIVSQMMFDELLQKYQSVDLGVMHPGDMFGEVSLLHNIARTATCTTTGHCELLALMKEDFKNVLQASVQKQWDEVLKAMSAFTYFEALDQVARREGCIVAKMKSYDPNETILGDGAGVPNFVYFVLSGRCQMIESIQMTATTHLGKTFYTLHDPHVSKAESEQDFDTKYFGNTNEDSKVNKSTELSVQVVNEKKSTSVDSDRKLSLKSPKGSKSGIIDPANASNTVVPKQRNSSARSTSEGAEILVASKTLPSRASIRLSIQPAVTVYSSPPSNLRTYFMQVCIMNPGSSFGFGENMRNRRIVALNKVDCMLMPKIWLLQRNTANIWTRIQHYLERKIPTTKQLFNEFVSSRRWQEFRDQLVEDVVARSNTVNCTSVHDVPYSIRMNETLDI